MHVHLTDRSSNFSPESVDVIVQRLEGEDLELRLLVKEET
jgi:hypothetical protein